jgi:hypothetical protein
MKESIVQVTIDSPKHQFSIPLKTGPNGNYDGWDQEKLDNRNNRKI